MADGGEASAAAAPAPVKATGPCTDLHRAAYDGDGEGVNLALRNGIKVDAPDEIGNTALIIAVMRGHTDCVHRLLEKNANPSLPGATKWPPLAEAISVGQKESVVALIKASTQQMFDEVKVTKFKDALEGIDDMYYEMEWDIHSWVPLVSRLFPSDTLKVWKRGKYIRLDTTLLNVSEHNLKRGARSYVISVNEQTDQIEMMTVDHESRTFATEVLFELPSLEERAEITARSSKEADVYMASELQDVDVTTSKVTFTPAQAGWIGFRHDREEEISGRTCRVYNINGLDIVSETRTEHLSDADIKWNKQHRKDLQAGRVPEDFEFPVRQSLPPPDRPKLTFDEYAAMAGDALKGGPLPPHLGRTMRIKSSVKHVKGMVWMCDADAWPLSTNVMLKLLTVLAPAGEHLKKVEAFLRTTMPPGFPLKLDVPVFPTVSARVTSSGCRPGEVDAALYEIPEGYEEISVEEMEDMHIDDEDEEEGDEQRAIEGGDEGEGEAGSSAIEGPAGDGDDDDEWEDAEDGDEGSTA